MNNPLIPIFKVLYLNPNTGEQGRLPDLAVINAGGVSGPTFTVGGRGLLFSDGTSSDGSNGSGITFSTSLQGAYDKSNVPANIILSTDKHFVLTALNSNFFSVNANTGKVTITGDLEVQGLSTVINGTVSSLNQVVINPPNANSSALIIEPEAGVTMLTDLVSISTEFSKAPAFTINAAGVTSAQELIVQGNITVNGLINSVDVVSTALRLAAHISNTGLKHKADQISISGPFDIIVGANVEQALKSIDQQLSSTVAAGGIQTWEHIQTSDSKIWTIIHGKNSTRPTVSIYGQDNIQILVDEVRIVDPNTITVSFSTASSGRAVILLF
jgi:hypothetical protein